MQKKLVNPTKKTLLKFFRQNKTDFIDSKEIVKMSYGELVICYEKLYEYLTLKQKQKKTHILTGESRNANENIILKNEREAKEKNIQIKFDFILAPKSTELLFSDAQRNILGEGYIVTLNNNRRILVVGLDSTINKMFDVYGTEKMRKSFFLVTKINDNNFGVKHVPLLNT